MIHSTRSRDTVRQAGPIRCSWLVRHGESTWNVRGLAQGHDDQARLTEHGRRQAWRIVGQLSDQPIRALYSSDLHRALETVAPLASVLRLAVTRDVRLRERCLGVAEGTATAAISPAVSGISAQRVVDPDARPPGGESLRDFYQRVACFAADLAARHPGARPGTSRSSRTAARSGCSTPTCAASRSSRWPGRRWPTAASCDHRRPGPSTRPTLESPKRGNPMNQTALHLPRRAAKPRGTGLTMVIDGGLPLWQFTDLVSSAAEYIDFVKFGWGTAVVTGCLDAKIEVLAAHDIGFYFGGTLFEKYVLQNRFDDFRKFCQEHSARHVEVSNGTIPMSNSEKASYIRKLADDFTVVSEVGFKDPVRSEQLPPSRWIEYIDEDLEAGASLVTLEARESGRSGICRPDGALRFGLIEDVLTSGISPGSLLFEAPTTALQAHFVTRIGPDVNLGNVPASAVIGLETLRLGLRADTLTAFE